MESSIGSESRFELTVDFIRTVAKENTKHIN